MADNVEDQEDIIGAQDVESESDWEDSEDEVDCMLDEALPDDFKKPPKIRKVMPNEHERIEALTNGESRDESESESGISDYVTNGNEDLHKFTEKVVTILEEKVKINQEDLPTGWIQIKHSSGMPVFLHRKTRVCTMSKPYRLGPGSARKHAVPLNAVPCLAYRKAIEKETDVAKISTFDFDSNPTVELPRLEITMNGGALNQSTSHEENVPMECSNGDPSADVSFSEPGESPPENVPALSSDDCVTVTEEKEDMEPGELSSSCDEDDNNMSVDGKISVNGTRTEKVTGSDTGEDSHTPSNNETAAGSGFAKKPATSIQERLGLKLDCPATPQITNDSVKQLIPEVQLESNVSSGQSVVKPEDLRQYCESLFRFTQVKTKRFKTWSDRRKHQKEQKRMHLQYPVLPQGMQIMKFPVQATNRDNQAGKSTKEQQQFYTMNCHGKSSVCILHEYVQHALRLQPSYKFGESRNSAVPYAATAMINNVQYGTGTGTSKKLAKTAAASATLEILIPQMKNVLKNNSTTSNDMYHIGYFDQVELDDPRIPKMCASVSEPSPYALLLACIQRNFGQRSTNEIKFEVVSTSSQANKFKMQTGEFSVEVTASNKREGKQLASQALLSKIHPHVKNFGSFLRLYGNGSIKSVKEKKHEEQQITNLQTKASANSPNYAILDKLREEMLKIQSKKLQEVKNSPQFENNLSDVNVDSNENSKVEAT